MADLHRPFQLDSDSEGDFFLQPRPQSSYWACYDCVRRQIRRRINETLARWRLSLHERFNGCHIDLDQADKFEECLWRWKGSAAEYLALLGDKLDKRMPFCFTIKIRDNRAVVSLRPRRELMGIIIRLQWWEDKEIMGENVEDSLLLAKQATRQRARRQWAGIPWRCWPRRVGGVVRHPRRGRASRRGVIV